jgi:hypothetical protein
MSVLNRYRGSAKKRGYDFDLTVEFIWQLFLRQNRRCALSGRELHFASRGRLQRESTASLDRIDSSRGYVQGNVQWLYKPLNKMKLIHSQEYFVAMCCAIADHQSAKGKR